MTQCRLKGLSLNFLVCNKWEQWMCKVYQESFRTPLHCQGLALPLAICLSGWRKFWGSIFTCGWQKHGTDMVKIKHLGACEEVLVYYWLQVCGRRRWEYQKSSIERAAQYCGLKAFHTNCRLAKTVLLVNLTYGFIAPVYSDTGLGYPGDVMRYAVWCGDSLQNDLWMAKTRLM